MKNYFDDENYQNPHFAKNALDDQVQGKHCQMKKQRSIDLYAHLKKKRQMPRLLTFYVQEPVYKEYAQINLAKGNIKHRIFRQKSITENEHVNQSEINSRLIENSSKWKESLQKYIESKQKSAQKYSQIQQIQGYPLMKLSKMNQRLRKIKTNPTFGDTKPQFIQKLEKQQLFNEKPLANRKSLPTISSNRKFNTSVKMKNSKKTNKVNQSSSTHQFRHQSHIIKVKEVIRQREKKKLFFKDMNINSKNSNKSEKVIINFIGNYFRQKFYPQRRYAYQRSYNQFDENLGHRVSQ